MNSGFGFIPVVVALGPSSLDLCGVNGTTMFCAPNRLAAAALCAQAAPTRIYCRR
jgi:hypothetical protein